MLAPFLLAPMAELSHRALRELIDFFRIRFYPPVPDRPEFPVEYFTEMISAGAFVAGGPFEEWYADGGPSPEKLVYQVVGGDAEQIARAAALLDKKECLGIDINMGCSAPAITRSGAGVRWMADIEKAAGLIGRVRPRIRKRLSVKLRTGLDDDFEYLVRFCRRLEEEGVELITLHPRTAKEKFRRRARWDYVSALGKELRIPLAGNGDIASLAEMLFRSQEHGAVMIGRLAVRRPWIFALGAAALSGGFPAPGEDAVRAPGTVDLEETGLLFLELLSRHQPPEFYLSRARRFFGFFCDNLKWGNHVKNILNREADISGMEKVWRAFFAENREEKNLIEPLLSSTESTG